MKVIFDGYYGVRNSGDDAFVEVAAWGSQKYWNFTDRVFIAPELPLITTPSKNLYAHKNIFTFIKSIHDVMFSDLFVSAGGSVFIGILSAKELRTYALLKKQMKWKGKTGAIGVSIGPFKNNYSEKKTIEYFKTLDFLALRDNASYEMALSYNLPFKPVRAFDLAALLPEIYSFKKENLNEDIIIGVSVCNYESYINGDISKEKKRNSYISALLKEIKKHKEIKFRFFIFNGHHEVGDEKLTQKLIAELNIENDFNYEIVPYQPEVHCMFEKISECTLVISTRLHAAIFACYGHCPFLLMEYHRKCSDFLNDVGHQDKYRIGDAETSIPEIVREIEEIVFENRFIPPAHIQDTIYRATLNFTETYSI